MSSATAPIVATDAAAAPAPAAPAAPAPAAHNSEINSAFGRVQKQFDALHKKNAKLTDEIARLKGQLATARASHSRVRRLPNKEKSDKSSETASE